VLLLLLDGELEPRNLSAQARILLPQDLPTIEAVRDLIIHSTMGYLVLQLCDLLLRGVYILLGFEGLGEHLSEVRLDHYGLVSFVL
jgi:hypothetical protein